MRSSILKSLLGLALIDVMMMGNQKTSDSNDGSFGHGIPDKKPKVIPKGCKEYTFYGITVVAISESSARKKCLKMFDKQHPRP